MIHRFLKRIQELLTTLTQHPIYQRYKKGWLILGVLLFIYAIVEFNFLWLFGSMPNFDRLTSPDVDITSQLISADGVILGRYYRENRTPVEYKKIHPLLIKTLIATEDARFYEHNGIDWNATLSIFYYMIRGDKRGGSTITQQLAKNLFKTRRLSSQGLLGYVPGIKVAVAKLKEWITAIKLEWVYSKDQIITMYLNTVDFGYNSYGIHTASKTFFSSTPDSLKPQEIAVLVGVLKATSMYSPILNPKNALKRRNTVLSIMARDHLINKATADSLKKLPIELKTNLSNHYEGQASYFRTMVEQFVNKWCKQHGYDLYADGLRIYTTLDTRLQTHAEAAVEEQMRTLQRRFFKHWEGENPWRDSKKQEIKGFLEDAIKHTHVYKKLKKTFPDNEDTIQKLLLQPKKFKLFTWNGDVDTTLSSMDSLKYYKHFLMAGFVVVDPKMAHVKAWVGGINYRYFQYDHVYQSKRQPGSTFKPFVYLAAIDSFGYSPCDRIVDQPVTIKYEEDSAGVMLQKVWRPRNSDWVYTQQNMTLRWAMGKSVNTVTAQLIDKIGYKAVINYARKLGIKSPLENVPSVGLGSSDVSLIELVTAYGTFLNEGKYADPIFVTKIEDNTGRVLAEFKPNFKRVISEETAWLMLYMLKGGLEEPGGTSQALFQFDLFRGNELGGKTGTSSNHSDGWFIGVSKDIIGGAWVGAADRSVHFRTSALGEGSKTALPIFGLFLEKAYKDKESGIKMGYFPKAKVPITKPHNCRTYLKLDSILVNTLGTLPDSSAAEEEEIIDEGE